MYNNSYEEYIRSVLGYPKTNGQELFQDCNSCNMQNPYSYNYGMSGQYDYNYSQNRSTELEDEYPEIYKIVYPMIKKSCKNISGTVTKDEVDRMVDEIYSNIEVNEQIHSNIAQGTQDNRTFNGKRIVEEPKMPDRMNKTKSISQGAVQENRSITEENRGGRFCNNGLCDLIRILVLRELIGNSGRPGGRPPFPPQGRPPFLQPPPNRPGRPPFYRELDNSIYEY